MRQCSVIVKIYGATILKSKNGYTSFENTNDAKEAIRDFFKTNPCAKYKIVYWDEFESEANNNGE